MTKSHQLPEWAPRVRPDLVRRLYRLDAQGLYDADLINDVGYSLYSRCLSFVEATDATAGRVHCPQCQQIVHHTGEKTFLLQCPCGWSLVWADYFATIQHQQLSGAEPVIILFNSYIERFPAARTLPEKMLLIDQLVHGFHWHAKHGYTRPVAVNLLEGRLADVIRVLDELSYGESSTPGIEERYRAWQEQSRNVRQGAAKDPQP